MNCPICNKKLQPTDTFCPGCGFEIHILPNEVSAEIEAYERERVRKYREKLEEYQNGIKEKEQEHERKEKDLSQQLSSSQKELESQKKAAEAKATSDQATKDQLTKKIDELTKDLEQRTEDLNKANQTSEDLQEKNKQLELKLQQIQVDNKQLLRQLEETGEKPVAFLVMIQGDDISAFYSIYEGENSFGYLVSHDKHQQILRVADFADNHFVIKATTSTDSKGRHRTKFFVAPKDGKIYRSANHSNIIDSEVEFEKNESIFVDDVKFTLVANKK